MISDDDSRGDQPRLVVERRVMPDLFVMDDNGGWMQNVPAFPHELIDGGSVSSVSSAGVRPSRASDDPSHCEGSYGPKESSEEESASDHSDPGIRDDSTYVEESDTSTGSSSKAEVVPSGKTQPTNIIRYGCIHCRTPTRPYRQYIGQYEHWDV